MSSAQKESSVLFSLHELMDLERDRIEAERQQRERAERAAAEAIAAEERRKIEAEYARARAVEEAALREEERRREEAARLSAMQLAEIHRAKADADHWAKLEAARQEHEHVQRLQALREDKGKKKLLYGVIVSVTLLVVLGVSGGIALKRSAEEAETARLAAEANRRERDSLIADGERLRGEQAQLDQRYRAAKTEADRLLLQKEQERIRAEEARIAGEIKRRTPLAGPSDGVKPSKPKPTCQCPPGDPLCACN